MAPVFQMLAAVAVPRTLTPCFRIAPPPIKPMPVIRPLNYSGLRIGISNPTEDASCGQEKTAAGNGNQREGTQPGAARILFSVPGDWECEHIRDTYAQKVSANLRPIKDRKVHVNRLMRPDPSRRRRRPERR